MSPSEAARQLGVSIKALRLYERRGLLSPARTSAGYRVYGADARTVDAALAAHEQALGKEIHRLASTMDKVRALRAPDPTEIAASFQLPWPWAGERFELRDIRPINYHSPPFRVAPYPGAPGFESVAACLASPEVRARLTSFAR